MRKEATLVVVRERIARKYGSMGVRVTVMLGCQQSGLERGREDNGRGNDV